MKAVILAGGYGTRISEESDLKPKPMVEIGGRPILWHIMKSYAAHGIQDFVICLGYKSYMIKEYFTNYNKHMSDMTIDLRTNTVTPHSNRSEDWRVTLIDTGEHTMTGGRLKRVADYVKDEKAFCLTYGDGVSDINISKLVKYHEQHGKKATLTAVRPTQRFGLLEMNDADMVTSFREKPQEEAGYINGGFFVLSPDCLNYIANDATSWEREPLEKLASEGQLQAYRHDGFWQCMDTLRDKKLLEQLWQQGQAPWYQPE